MTADVDSSSHLESVTVDGLNLALLAGAAGQEAKCLVGHLQGKWQAQQVATCCIQVLFSSQCATRPQQSHSPARLVSSPGFRLPVFWPWPTSLMQMLGCWMLCVARCPGNTVRPTGER